MKHRRLVFAVMAALALLDLIGAAYLWAAWPAQRPGLAPAHRPERTDTTRSPAPAPQRVTEAHAR